MLALRFATASSSGSEQAVLDHVQITVAESIGNRGPVRRTTSVPAPIRDIFQNHLLQLVCDQGMEASDRLHGRLGPHEKLKC